MDSVWIREQVQRLPQIAAKGGRRKGLSFPLLRELDGIRFVVYLVYIYDEGIPDAFVVYREGDASPEYLSNGDALELLQMKPEELSSGDGGDGVWRQEIPEDAEHLFSDIIEREETNREWYELYLDMILPAVRPDRRAVYRAVAGL